MPMFSEMAFGLRSAQETIAARRSSRSSNDYDPDLPMPEEPANHETHGERDLLFHLIAQAVLEMATVTRTVRAQAKKEAVWEPTEEQPVKPWRLLRAKEALRRGEAAAGWIFNPPAPPLKGDRITFEQACLFLEADPVAVREALRKRMAGQGIYID